jgi:hypothetical protein
MARRTAGAHKHITDNNVLHTLRAAIEHEDWRASRMAARWSDPKRVGAGGERSKAALDEGFLAGS